MKMLAASEPEIAENLDSDVMEKLTYRRERRSFKDAKSFFCNEAANVENERNRDPDQIQTFTLHQSARSGGLTWGTDSAGSETGCLGRSSAPPPLHQELPDHHAPRPHWSTPWQPLSPALLPIEKTV